MACYRFPRPKPHPLPTKPPESVETPDSKRSPVIPRTEPNQPRMIPWVPARQAPPHSPRVHSGQPPIKPNGKIGNMLFARDTQLLEAKCSPPIKPNGGLGKMLIQTTTSAPPQSNPMAIWASCSSATPSNPPFPNQTQFVGWVLTQRCPLAPYPPHNRTNPFKQVPRTNRISTWPSTLLAGSSPSAVPNEGPIPAIDNHPTTEQIPSNKFPERTEFRPGQAACRLCRVPEDAPSNDSRNAKTSARIFLKS